MSNLPIPKQITTPTLPETWNYEESVTKVKTLVYRWTTLGPEILTELWIAREKLSVSESDAAKIMHGTKVPGRTWSDYCLEIGSQRRVVNRWLLAFKEKRKQVTKKDIKEPIYSPEEFPETSALKPGQSRNLSLLKDAWLRANKKDRKRFLEWLIIRGEVINVGQEESIMEGGDKSEKDSESSGLAMQLAKIAVGELRKISPEDSEGEEALNYVERWIEKKIFIVLPTRKHASEFRKAVKDMGASPRVQKAIIKKFAEGPAKKHIAQKLIEAKQIELGERKPPAKSKGELAGEAFKYNLILQEIILKLPKEPPKHLTEGEYAALKGMAIIIINRLRRFEE